MMEDSYGVSAVAAQASPGTVLFNRIGISDQVLSLYAHVIYICMYVYIYVAYMYICMYVYLLGAIINISVCMYVCMHACFYVYSYIYLYTHTHHSCV